MRRRWRRSLLLGELIGFFPPAVIGSVLAAAGASDVGLVLGLTGAGLIEGAAIGIAGARVLAHAAPLVDGRRWVSATVAASGFAWLAGMGGAAVMGSPIGSPMLLFALVPLWLLALASMGYLQWRVLRRALPGSVRWIPVSAAAWLIGIMLPVAAVSLVPEGSPGVLRVLAAITGAVAMGWMVGDITGRTLERLLEAGGRGAPETLRRPASSHPTQPTSQIRTRPSAAAAARRSESGERSTE